VRHEIKIKQQESKHSTAMRYMIHITAAAKKKKKKDGGEKKSSNVCRCSSCIIDYVLLAN